MKEKEGNRSGKREVIIQAALEVFSAQGFHRSHMKEIAERAGIGKGTVYEYFSSKMDLFKAVLRESFDFYYMLTKEGEEDASIETRLYHLFLSHANFCCQHKLGGFLFREQQSMGEEFEAWFHELTRQRLEKVKLVLRAAIEAGEIRPVDMDVLNGVILGITAGMMIPIAVPLHSGRGETQAEVAERVARGALDVLLHGIKR